MSENTSKFVTGAGLSLAVLGAVIAVFASGGGASASSFEECPPPVTTTLTVGPDGNPWYG
ncbi:hypothetical protein [Saccharothrix texasensis]|uniref:Uncharacterized protein n=1 Tax=Saccharothrix texasensis TaxID=103734 RepID=A0A3N1H6S2_9PSEU|nr:hypothetical protein [Saccharothrix texasensis]ROP38189.1 hypothetical protein EDD40_3530 [Saccharothrix texasensis]